MTALFNLYKNIYMYIIDLRNVVSSFVKFKQIITCIIYNDIAFLHFMKNIKYYKALPLRKCNILE